MAFVIAEPCIGIRDGSCADVCPVDCIHSDEAQAQYFIDPAACIDCGACATMCPVGAIFYETDVPVSWLQSAARNAAYFQRVERETMSNRGATIDTPAALAPRA